MRYTFEFKMECIELYRQGEWMDTPDGVKTKNFHDQVREWVRIEEAIGIDALKHKNSNRKWTPESRYELVARVLAGESKNSVAISAGINEGLLYQWVRKYKIYGYNGLVTLKKGRKPKGGNQLEKVNPKVLTESEREELIRLRAENKYIKAENEVIKKQIALRHEKWAAQLKAKKQQLSKNSEKKDIN